MAQCWSSVRGRRMRVTLLDECGAPQFGAACGVVVTKGFISVAWSPNVAEGEEIEVRNAGGELCIADQGCPELKWIDVEMEFCNVDPDLVSLLTGYPVVDDFSGDPVGFRVTEQVECETGFAVELWSDIPGEACPPGGKAFGYWLAPYLKHGIIGDVTVENAEATFSVTARTFGGSQWGTGPWDVDPQDAAGTAGPLLTPIGDSDHLDIHLTTIAPPDDVCGCTAVPAESPS